MNSEGDGQHLLANFGNSQRERHSTLAKVGNEKENVRPVSTLGKMETKEEARIINQFLKNNGKFLGYLQKAYSFILQL